MENTLKPRYCKMRTTQVYINKGGELQHKIWKPGELKVTTVEA